MSAAKRVAHAAETIRARWERQVVSDPQTEAAQALEDTGQLLNPEVAAELAAFRALELGAVDGRVSAACGEPGHPTWLRQRGDVRRCPWCRVAELEAELGVANGVLEDVAKARRAEANCPCPPEGRPHQVGCTQVEVPSLRAQLEDPHDGPLARSFRLGHDLDMPQTGGERRG